MHRLLGLAVAAVVVLHPVLVFLPERMWFIPLELRYWPEFTGLLLLVTLAGSALVSTWRTAFGLPFHIWWLGHRVGAVLIVALLAVHVLNVSESFEQGLPRQALFAALGGWLLLYAWVRTRGVRSRRRPLEGDLTIKDVTRTVSLPLTWFGVQENPLKKNQLVAGIEVAFSLDRMEYGVGTGKFLEMGVLGKDVQVLVALEVVRDK
ncbi:MAG: YceI family protein [Desulfovibrionales bacterium]